MAAQQYYTAIVDPVSHCESEIDDRIPEVIDLGGIREFQVPVGCKCCPKCGVIYDPSIHDCCPELLILAARMLEAQGEYKEFLPSEKAREFVFARRPQLESYWSELRPRLSFEEVRAMTQLFSRVGLLSKKHQAVAVDVVDHCEGEIDDLISMNIAAGKQCEIQVPEGWTCCLVCGAIYDPAHLTCCPNLLGVAVRMLEAREVTEVRPPSEKALSFVLSKRAEIPGWWVKFETEWIGDEGYRMELSLNRIGVLKAQA